MKRTGHSIATRTSGTVAPTVLALALGLLLLVASAPAQAADPPLLTQFGNQGSAAGQTDRPQGIATNPNTGNIYVTDTSNRRINEFTAWGVFVKAWGWGVKDGSKELQTCTTASGCLEGLKGTGAGQIGDAVGITLDSSGNVYIVEENFGYEGYPSGPRVQKFTPSGQFLLAWGGDVVADGPDDSTNDERQEVTVNASGGTFRLKFANPLTGPGNAFIPPEETSNLPYNASAAQIESALNALPTIGGLGGSVTVSGGPGGSTPYKVTFEGILSGDDMPVLTTASSLSGGTPSISVITPNQGGASEICKAADVCKGADSGTANGEFSAMGTAIAVGPGDKVYVGDRDRIQRFDTEGAYVSQIPLPEAGPVGALAVDQSTGDLYFAYYSIDEPLAYHLDEELTPNVFKLNPTTGQVLDTLTVEIPHAIAVDPKGSVYVFEGHVYGGDGAPGNKISRVRQFDTAGNQTAVLLEGKLNLSRGLATGSACGIEGTDLYVANAFSGFSTLPTFIRAYGPPPNPQVCPPPSVPPTVEDTYALSAGSDAATVGATINPHFWPNARYFVQYGTGKCSEGGCEQNRPASPGALLTSKVLDASIRTPAVFLGDLAPDTTYHYRFVAQSSGGGPVEGPELTFHTLPTPTPPPSTDPCPNAGFRTGFSAKLPDCRAYELVSPLDKNNGDVAANSEGVTTREAGSIVQAAADGGRMIFSSTRAFAGAEASPLVSQYLAARDPATGWSTRSISPPRGDLSYYPTASGETMQYKAFTEDLCSGWVLQDTGVALTPGAFTPVSNLYRRRLCDPEGYELLTTVAPPGFSGFEQGNSSYYPIVQGFSADGERSVFHADAALTPNANPKKGIYQAYEAYDGEKLRLVSVLPNGAAATTHSTLGTPQGGGNLEGGFREGSVYHAVSDDGSRVYWTASEDSTPAGGGPIGFNHGKLYLRINATEAQSKIAAGKCTEAAKACTIALSQDPNSVFLGADPQGDKAIYGVGAKLFEFDLATESSQLIAEGFQGVMGTSEDLSLIYLASKNVLSGEATNSAGDKAFAGEPNLYLYDAGKASFTFVASFDEDVFVNDSFPFNSAPSGRSARVTPDGLAAVFMSRTQLTGYDNSDTNEPVQADTEVFRYDAGANGGPGKLSCVSCNPTGARPVGKSLGICAEGICHWYSALIPGWQTQTHPSRVLSEDGNRIFFNSFDALVSRDTNGREDVYQWEAPGSGSCSEEDSSFSAANDGCITLISSGESPSDSEFFDASASGSDAFFLTQSSLLAQDYGLRDVYDARVNGGFPAPPARPPACEGEACQGPLTPPNDPTPASSAYEGPGNPKAAAKKKQAKKHKKQSKKHTSAKKHKSVKRAKHNGRAGR